MQLSVTFRHMDSTDALKDYAKDKVERIRKYFPDPISAHVTLSTERGYQHAADVLIQLHNGLTIKGHEATEDMYSSIDLVMAKIERQVRRYKEKLRSHQGQQHLGAIAVAHSVISDSAEGDESASATAQPPKPSFQIVKTQKVAAQPLAVEDAIMQLNLVSEPFLVFRNAATGQVNVVYRREDGNYGLIETGGEDGAGKSGHQASARA
jgi:putative sigma-54 modulation protein